MATRAAVSQSLLAGSAPAAAAKPEIAASFACVAH